MKLKKFIFSLGIIFIVCFGSLSRFFLLKSLIVVFFTLAIDFVRRIDLLDKIESLKSELLLNRSIFVSDFDYIIDIDDIDLTEGEYEILEYICRYNPSNLNLCKKFGKSLSTIKNQLKVIMDKTGVDNRYDLIMSCRSNFE